MQTFLATNRRYCNHFIAENFTENLIFLSRVRSLQFEGYGITGPRAIAFLLNLNTYGLYTYAPHSIAIDFVNPITAALVVE